MPDCEAFHHEPVTGFLHRPEGEPRKGLVLTHGAGGNCEAPLLVAVAEAFRAHGYVVLRFDLPFRQHRRFGPPHPSSAAADREGIRAAVQRLRSLIKGTIAAGGHSYGGRQTSMLAAEDPELADGLLLLSYPLHPPKKPDQLRTAHFSKLRIPATFVHGDADPFGTIREMTAATAELSGPHRLVVIAGAGHDLKRGKFDLQANVIEPFESLLASAGAEKG